MIAIPSVIGVCFSVVFHDFFSPLEDATARHGGLSEIREFDFDNRHRRASCTNPNTRGCVWTQSWIC